MLEKIKAVFAEKNYRFFEGERNINLIGIRKNDSLTNEFDDKLLVVITLNGETQVKEFGDFTTDPGYHYLKEKLLNEDGCAILKPGQYLRMWKLGKHKGKYPIDKGIEDTGLFGINMHHAYDREEIGPYSAGCQVHSDDEQLKYILQLCKISAEYFGIYFSYTLLEEKDLEETQAEKVKEVRKTFKLRKGKNRNRNKRS